MKQNKAYVILQQTPPQTYLPRSNDEGIMSIVPNYRGRWKLMGGFEFVKKFFPRTKNWDFNVHMLSNNQVKAMLHHAKKYPKVLEVAFLPPEKPLIQDDRTSGDDAQAELPESNESGACDATVGGDTQTQ